MPRKQKKMNTLFLCILIVILTFTVWIASPSEPIVQEHNQFIHDIAVSKSKTKIPVPVLCVGKRLYTGIITHHADSIMRLLEMNYKLRANRSYEHRSQLQIVTISSDFDHCFLPFVFNLCHPQAHLFSQTPISNRDVVELHSKPLFVYRFQKLPAHVHLPDLMIEKCLLKGSVVFYRYSQRREDAIHEAYETDLSFHARTTTGVIHGCVLRAMFPSIHISFSNDNTPTFQRALDFYNDLLKPI